VLVVICASRQRGSRRFQLVTDEVMGRPKAVVDLAVTLVATVRSSSSSMALSA
jgi:hypothetical protein